MEFVIITGMSGAGKSQAIKIFEDMGYFCVDNMPVALFSKFAELTMANKTNIKKVAFVIDIRNASIFSEIEKSIEEFENSFGKCYIVFLDAKDEVLIKRYKETRRKHPLFDKGNLVDNIKKERQLMDFMRKKATYVIDTSYLGLKEFSQVIKKSIESDYDPSKDMVINVVSFGFKYGILIEADLVYDVRFLPNPYYLPELKSKTGLDDEVVSYVENSDITKEFLTKLKDMIEFLIPNYINEGKSSLVIGFGCTCGKHRSVTMARKNHSYINELGYKSVISHRDINKE